MSDTDQRWVRNEVFISLDALVTVEQLARGDGHSPNLNGLHGFVGTNATVDVGRAHLRSISAGGRDDEGLVRVGHKQLVSSSTRVQVELTKSPLS